MINHWRFFVAAIGLICVAAQTQPADIASFVCEKRNDDLAPGNGCLCQSDTKRESFRDVKRSILKAHTDWITCIAISPDSRTLASSSWDGAICVWDRASEKLLHRLDRQSDGMRHPVCGVAFSPDARVIVSANQSGGIRFWDASTGKFLRQVQERHYDVYSVAFCPDGKRLAIQSGKSAKLLDVATGQDVRSCARADSHGTALAISPDGEILISAGNLNLYFWELGSGKLISRQSNRFCFDVAFSPSGLLIASAGAGSVLIQDPSSGREIVEIDDVRPNSGRPIAFSPDGRFLAVSEGKDVRFWDIGARGFLSAVIRHDAPVSAIAFAPDGDTLVCGGRDGAVLLCKVAGMLPALEPMKANALLDQLKHSDKLRVHMAFSRLRANPDHALAALKDCLERPAAGNDMLLQRIKDLDSPVFETREMAMKELRKTGRAAEQTLHSSRKNHLSLEARRRIDLLLHDLDVDPDRPFVLLCVRLLESINTEPARDLLRALERREPDTHLADAARKALLRVGTQHKIR